MAETRGCLCLRQSGEQGGDRGGGVQGRKRNKKEKIKTRNY